MARASDGLRLMDDCKLLEDDRTVAVIGSAIGLSLGELRKDPRRLVGQLVGRLMWAAGLGEEEEEGEKKVMVENGGNLWIKW